ncbi:DUF5655 domain-containing protein [Mycetocola zhadangensis]|uniref:DUF4287 domain-containing protein n=1 Tax=Mycetocola zhadangensis TaxID=1164595 RepID=A0A3L7IST6_9MICO|nr:DUF5655 domain-containing protein [Mycetocola zhadangensis]RLQ81170.1 DUF4287 domain-containing protein [Mycetocola zhadangensis]GGF05344.1 hypothetical protein GCM10011313_30630 [Mycetocola zhadangensis]
MDAETQKRIDGLPASTGKSLTEWFTVLDAAQLQKHGEMMALLKGEHGVSHGFANFIALMYRNQGAPEGDDLIEKQYATKPSLRPIYDAIVHAVGEFGTDVQLAPKSATVSLRRSKQFALISPTTKTRVDVGINLRGTPGGERLKATGGMCTHSVGVASVDEVDDELLSWLREAYDLA